MKMVEPMKLVPPLQGLRSTPLDPTGPFMCFVRSIPYLLSIHHSYLHLGQPCFHGGNDTTRFLILSLTMCGRTGLPPTDLLTIISFTLELDMLPLLVKMHTQQPCFDTTFHEPRCFLSSHVAIRQLKPLEVAKLALPRSQLMMLSKAT